MLLYELFPDIDGIVVVCKHPPFLCCPGYLRLGLTYIDRNGDDLVKPIVLAQEGDADRGVETS